MKFRAKKTIKTNLEECEQAKQRFDEIEFDEEYECQKMRDEIVE